MAERDAKKTRTGDAPAADSSDAAGDAPAATSSDAADAANAADSSDAADAEDAAPAAPAADAPTADAAPADASECAVCHSSAAECTLVPHGCARCVAGAWGVCESCHASLLSRTCPICRGVYAPLEYFEFAAMPSLRPPDAGDGDAGGGGADGAEDDDAEERSRRRAEYVKRFIQLRLVVKASNVVAYRAADRTACFLLPTELGAACAAWLVVVNVPLPAGVLVDAGAARAGGAAGRPPRFLFTNAVWDAIEEEARTRGACEREREREGRLGRCKFEPPRTARRGDERRTSTRGREENTDYHRSPRDGEESSRGMAPAHPPPPPGGSAGGRAAAAAAGGGGGLARSSGPARR